MSSQCGAFCSFCGRCGRTVAEEVKAKAPIDVLPPGISRAKRATKKDEGKPKNSTLNTHQRA